MEGHWKFEGKGLKGHSLLTTMHACAQMFPPKSFHSHHRFRTFDELLLHLHPACFNRLLFVEAQCLNSWFISIFCSWFLSYRCLTSTVMPIAYTFFPCCAAHGFFTIKQKEESREQKRETNKFVKESVRAIIGVKNS